MTASERSLIAAVGVILIASIGLACGSGADSSGALDDNERAVTRASYGDEWPLTVGGGILRCDEPFLVTFTSDDGRTWAVNGAARGFAEERGWVDDISPIWKDDPVIAGVKINIGPLIDDGLAICDG